MSTNDSIQVDPKDCPEPFWHETHRYCPACSWTEPKPGPAFKVGDEVVVTYVAKVTDVNDQAPMIGVSVPPLDTLWRYPSELQHFPEGVIS